MLKGIKVNGEIKFVEVTSKEYPNAKLVSEWDLLMYIEEVGDILEDTEILIDKKVIKVNEDTGEIFDVLVFGINDGIDNVDYDKLTYEEVCVLLKEEIIHTLINNLREVNSKI